MMESEKREDLSTNGDISYGIILSTAEESMRIGKVFFIHYPTTTAQNTDVTPVYPIESLKPNDFKINSKIYII